MIEFLKHATGLCGEPHPSLLTLLAATPLASYFIYKLKTKGGKIISEVTTKKSLRRKKELVDSISATIILQSYLEKNNKS